LTSLVPPNVTPQQAASFPIPLLTAVQVDKYAVFLVLLLTTSFESSRLSTFPLVLTSPNRPFPNPPKNGFSFGEVRLQVIPPPVSSHFHDSQLKLPVGIYAIQLAKLSGLRVATTASPKKWEYLRSLGADYTVDYKDPEVIDKLKEATTNSLQYGLDCVTNRESYRKAAMVFRPDGGKLITTLFDLESTSHMSLFLIANFFIVL